MRKQRVEKAKSLSRQWKMFASPGDLDGKIKIYSCQNVWFVLNCYLQKAVRKHEQMERFGKRLDGWKRRRDNVSVQNKFKSFLYGGLCSARIRAGLLAERWVFSTASWKHLYGGERTHRDSDAWKIGCGIWGVCLSAVSFARYGWNDIWMRIRSLKRQYWKNVCSRFVKIIGYSGVACVFAKEIQWIKELTGGTWKHIGGNLWKLFR